MSEPVQKGEIDLTSLDQALNDGEAASEVSASTLQKNSDTLSQPPAEVGKVAAASKAKLALQQLCRRARRELPLPRRRQPFQPAENVPPAVAELRLMFPDLDNETIGAVLSSRGGDQEAAVNALLQMSDPEFKPSNAETNTDSDALLAQSVAMEEEHRHQAEMARRQQQQQASMGRGGGGAGSFFSGLMGSDGRDSAAATSPSYDPNALTYQPRVRRGAPAAGARTSYMPPSHTSPAASPSYERGDSVVPGMPGAKEAKQWQEGINRMAETGLARAASTFSNFRQKASAAFNNPQEGQGQPGAVPSSGSGASSGSGFAQAFQNFRNNAAVRSSSTSSQAPATAAATSPRQFTSPRSPHASEYDQDPSPVSDNELAKIISRGGAGGSSDASGGKARALAERYGLGIKNGGRGGAGASQTGGSAAGASDYAGWDQAGRTPISISDNTVKAVQEKRSDSIDRMDGAGGRGITSPRLDRSPTKETSTATKVGAAAVGGAAVGAGAGAAVAAKHDDGEADGDSDDLEYVSNPFEDED